MSSDNAASCYYPDRLVQALRICYLKIQDWILTGAWVRVLACADLMSLTIQMQPISSLVHKILKKIISRFVRAQMREFIVSLTGSS